MLLKQKTFLNPGLLFFFAILSLLYALFHINSGFPDPDSFYHLKLAKDIFSHGLMTDFPWLPFTVLDQHYADHHLLYHILLSFSLFFFEPILAMKVFTAFTSVVTIFIFYFLLKKYTLPFPIFFTFLLAFSANYVFRLQLGKTVALINIFLLLALYIIFERKYIFLILLSFLYVWLYGGFILILVLIFFFVMAEAIQRKSVFVFFKKENIWLYLSSIFGLILGLVINPYFPENLFFYYHQVIDIGILNNSSDIIIGSEWAMYEIWPLFATHFPVFLLFFFSSAFFLMEYKKTNQKSLTLFLLSFFFLFFTLKSQRYIEYFIPIAILFIAFSFPYFVRYTSMHEAYCSLRAYFDSKASFFKKALLIAFVIYSCIALIWYCGKSYYQVYVNMSFIYEEEMFKGASEYIRLHSQPGDIVFHTAFDEFPMLLYHNDVNSYILGLDSRFLYNNDPNMYQLWEDIIMGKVTKNLYNTLKTQFNAKFVLVATDWNALNPLLHQDSRFVPVYIDEYASVYQLR